MDDQSYSGQRSYLYIEPLLKERSNELLVISPYISDDYARMLVDLGRSKRVRVITSGSSTDLKGYANRYSWGSLFSYVKVLAVIFLVGIAAVYLQLYYALYVLIAAFALVLVAGYMRFRSMRMSNIDVRSPKGSFVHEKMYISDSSAAFGSANLTYSGMHRNIEHIQVTSDPAKVEGLRRHFKMLWDQSR